MTIYTPESILSSLGYANPFEAARQHARMILLGRLAHYQAETQAFEAKWGCSLAEMQTNYIAFEKENFAADDDYLQWRWVSEAVETVEAQLAALTRG